MKFKGATKFDKLCHQIFSARSGSSYLSRETGVLCGRCGIELEVYYCESRLYLVECRKCKTKALTEAFNPRNAAYRTFAHAVYPVDQIGEEEGVFFDHIPINEPPCYVGSVIDSDFPDDAVCGIYLPCPGTNGEEIKQEENQ